MEIEEIEAVLEKIWDLHDKLSDAIHTITRSHFLTSVKSLRKPKKPGQDDVVGENNRSTGFVYVKDYKVNSDNAGAMIEEAKSLYVIRTALEDLEDQLEFFRTMQAQQQAERDAAIARLEQSRIVLAMRLAEHHGKKYNVIEEALAFVGDVGDAGRFVSPENLYGPSASLSKQNFGTPEGKRSNILFTSLTSSLNFIKNFLKLDHATGILGNAALFALSMVALLHLQQAACKKHEKHDDNLSTRKMRKNAWMEGPSSYGQLDVSLARG